MALSCGSLGLWRNPHFSCTRLYQLQLSPKARSQSFGDEEGKNSNRVDANMSVLRSRMEAVRRREKGWNYRYSENDDVRRKIEMQCSSSIELATIAFTSIALVFLFGSLSILLLSFTLHFFN